MSRAWSSVVRSAFLSLALILGIGVASSFAGTDVGSIHFTLGYKNLSGDWNLNPRDLDASGEPLPGDRTSYPSLGIEGTWGPKSWPVQLAFDVLNSADDGIRHVPQFFNEPAYDLRLRANTLEVGFGARRAFDVIGLSPYVGAGGLWARGKVEIEVNDPYAGQFGTRTGHAHAHSDGFGYWLGGGVTRRLGPRFHLGLGFRFSKANLSAEPFTVDQGTLPFVTSFPEADAGGRTFNLVVGWSFPSH
jgi:opacity protein-like surface antigen